ncbi:exonuclease mut-7 homolog isoform X2 [Olea europaea var. sylvestris]|uniref:Exonuclease mut-7 homolog isoform X2 n=1 Tax=Olea europaea subsp. europaea TaxID=158383 RepID=A0A8S0TSS2_OLEEU|nr:exonuclease mut-7 homolog isoform X2 [Olea europaea var. sylvestris]CAA3007013.1 exonuclease mut-7 homolog isoform X2 [Olea europaea subsp. europaea]
MRMDERIPDRQTYDRTHQAWSVGGHAFSDLPCMPPLVFVYLLKECYAYGTCKATAKFHVLQEQVHQVLYNDPQPGPATFIAYCLCLLPVFETHREGLSHLIISALRRFLKTGSTSEDILNAKLLAAKLFLDITGGSMVHDERILLKILQVFDVGLETIEEVIHDSSVKRSKNIDTAKELVEQYIFELIESESFMNAVSLLEHFSIRKSGESFLLKMMQCGEYKAAEKWATFMGKSMLCVLVREYVDRKLVKLAYSIIKKNNMHQEFPELYHQYKESSLKKLAEKGVWDVAEARANADKQLLEYLVYLAMEAGYSEKVEELCDRYSLKGFVNVKELEANVVHNSYLHLDELLIEDVVWVDEVNGLLEATSYFEDCKIIGIDCEWKPNYEKGSKPSKVSIMQIASEKKVYIFDLIKLYEDVPTVLDECLARVLQSPSVLKLGYNYQCDAKQLAHSYGDLNCFKQCEMLLDIQNVFKEPGGGLSGLAKKILGAGLNKTRRNSNWEQRPLTQYQLEYAALDAAVLLHIFQHVSNHSLPTDSLDEHSRIEWKSCIVSHMDITKMAKKGAKTKRGFDPGTNESSESITIHEPCPPM